MRQDVRFWLGRWTREIAQAVFLLVVWGASTSGAQQEALKGNEATPAELRGGWLDVPINTIVPGAISVEPKINIPASDPAAAQRGMKAFSAFNCVGCHMGNGGGGMGPALSNRAFIYGSQPANIYLTIVQGRPRGMPAWGAVLPDAIVWDLVAYIKGISNAPVGNEWGTTTAPGSPAIEQVPAELQATTTPWAYTQKFSNGQKP
jgi:cytochrome c oxidase cbb3-type subunit 3